MENILSLSFEKRQNQCQVNANPLATFGQIFLPNPEILTWRYAVIVIVVAAFCVPYGQMNFPVGDSYFRKDCSHEISFPEGLRLRAVRI